MVELTRENDRSLADHRSLPNPDLFPTTNNAARLWLREFSSNIGDHSKVDTALSPAVFNKGYLGNPVTPRTWKEDWKRLILPPYVLLPTDI